MQKIYIIIIISICSLKVSGQEIETFSQAKRYIGKGTLNNLDITITLDFIFRMGYSSEHCISKYYNHIIGTYYYDGIGSEIPLVGENILWTAENGSMDSLILFELNSGYEKTALFAGKMTKHNFSGQWGYIKSKKRHTFNINWENSYIGNLKVNWKDREFILPDINITSHQGMYEIIHTFEKDEKLILIVQTTVPCCGAYNCRGSNCGGANEYLYLYQIEDDCIRTQKELISSSCSEAAVLHRSKTPDTYGLAIENEQGCYILKIDYNDLGKGIHKTKLEN